MQRTHRAGSCLGRAQHLRHEPLPLVCRLRGAGSARAGRAAVAQRPSVRQLVQQWHTVAPAHLLMGLPSPGLLCAGRTRCPDTGRSTGLRASAAALYWEAACQHLAAPQESHQACWAACLGAKAAGLARSTPSPRSRRASLVLHLGVLSPAQGLQVPVQAAASVPQAGRHLRAPVRPGSRARVSPGPGGGRLSWAASRSLPDGCAHTTLSRFPQASAGALLRRAAGPHHAAARPPATGCCGCCSPCQRRAPPCPAPAVLRHGQVWRSISGAGRTLSSFWPACRMCRHAQARCPQAAPTGQGSSPCCSLTPALWAAHRHCSRCRSSSGWCSRHLLGEDS